MSRPRPIPVAPQRKRAISAEREWSVQRRITNAKKQQMNKDRFIAALSKYKGLINVSLKATGLSRAQVYHWRNTDPEFHNRWEECLDEQLEFAIGHLYQHIANGSEKCAMFMIKHLGHRQNWTERKELVGAGGAPLMPQVDVNLETIREAHDSASVREAMRAQLEALDKLAFVRGKLAARKGPDDADNGE